MSQKNTKTERLLLNTTHEERKFIKELLDRGPASTNSDLMREAFQQYLSFHDRVRKGDEIIVRSAGGRGQRSIFIPLEWRDSTYRDSDQGASEAEVKEAPARKLLARLGGFEPKKIASHCKSREAWQKSALRRALA